MAVLRLRGPDQAWMTFPCSADMTMELQVDGGAILNGLQNSCVDLNS